MDNIPWMFLVQSNFIFCLSANFTNPDKRTQVGTFGKFRTLHFWPIANAALPDLAVGLNGRLVNSKICWIYIS